MKWGGSTKNGRFFVFCFSCSGSWIFFNVLFVLPFCFAFLLCLFAMFFCFDNKGPVWLDDWIMGVFLVPLFWP